MSKRTDPDRSIYAWLVTEAPVRAPDHLLAASRARLRTTRQRRAWGPARRILDMNAYAKLAVAAAAVLVVAVIGVSLLPGTGNMGGGGASPSTSPTPTPAPPMGQFLPAGLVAPGRYEMIRESVPLSIDVPTGAWSSNGGFWFGGGGVEMFFWSSTPDGIRLDPCSEERGPIVAHTAVDLAAAVASAPGLEHLAGPDPVTVGGQPAQRVTVRVPDDAPCPADGFFLWYEEDFGDRYPSGLGHTITVWIIDVDGTPIWIDVETGQEASAATQQFAQDIIDSIEFQPAPGASATAALAGPSAVATSDPVPSPLPEAGELAVGAYAFTPLPGNVVGGLIVPTEGWRSGGDNPRGGAAILKGTPGAPNGARISISTSPVGVYADPCGHVLRDMATHSAADLASAIAAIPGTDLIEGPTPARDSIHVVLTVREDIPCEPGAFYLWKAPHGGPRAALGTNSTIRVWIPPGGTGSPTFVEAETYDGASPALEREVQQIVDSVWGGG